MRVNTNSWHYRLIDFFSFEHPYNLCPYCWKVLFTIAFALFVATMAGLVAFSVLSIGLRFFFPSLGPVASAAGTVLIGLLCIALFVIGKDRRDSERWKQIESGTYVEREPSLLWSWIKAGHDKVCPQIDFYRPASREEHS